MHRAHRRRVARWQCLCCVLVDGVCAVEHHGDRRERRLDVDRDRGREPSDSGRQARVRPHGRVERLESRGRPMGARRALRGVDHLRPVDGGGTEPPDRARVGRGGRAQRRLHHVDAASPAGRAVPRRLAVRCRGGEGQPRCVEAGDGRGDADADRIGRRGRSRHGGRDHAKSVVGVPLDARWSTGIHGGAVDAWSTARPPPIRSAPGRSSSSIGCPTSV